MALIDILLPTYNNGFYLSEALISVLKQSLTDFRILVMDDGSTDDSLSRIPIDSRIEVHFLAHKGIVHALNKGLELCSAEWIARFDGDDLMTPDRLEKQLQFAEAENRDWVSCNVELFGEKNDNRGYQEYVTWHNSLIDLTLSRYIECPMIHPTWMLKRNIFLKNGFYREGSFPEDYEFFLRSHENCRLGKVPETLMYWRDSGTRLSRTDQRYSEEAFRALKTDYFPWDTQTPFMIVGAGEGGRKIARKLIQRGYSLKGFIDIDPKKIGRKIYGLPVISREEFEKQKSKPFLINALMTRGSRKIVEEWLESLELIQGMHFFHFQ